MARQTGSAANRPAHDQATIMRVYDESVRGLSWVRQQFASPPNSGVGATDDNASEIPRLSIPVDAGAAVRPELHLLGLMPELGRGNRMTVERFQQRMSDQPFARLLRLIVARAETDDGFMDGDRLVEAARDEKLQFGPNEVNRAIKHIRDPLFPFFGDEVVEISRRRVRLNPEILVTWDLESLLCHSSAEITGLARRLPV